MAAGVQPLDPSQAEEALRRAELVVDALIGYSLRGAPRGKVAGLIELCNQHAARVLSLDLPSGLDATTGEARGVVVCPTRTLTLALPKTGLLSAPGELYLADIGIPPQVYRRMGLSVALPFGGRYWIRLERGPPRHRPRGLHTHQSGADRHDEEPGAGPQHPGQRNRSGDDPAPPGEWVRRRRSPTRCSFCSVPTSSPVS